VITHARLRFARVWWLCGWVLVAYVIWGCLEPASWVPNFHVSDKIEHAGAYFLMTFWFGGLLQRRRFPVMVVGFLALGAAIEVAQGLMGLGRTADVWDFAADSVGVAAAIVPAYLGLDSWMFYVEQRFGVS
jgi:VanZ family protein